MSETGMEKAKNENWTKIVDEFHYGITFWTCPGFCFSFCSTSFDRDNNNKEQVVSGTL